MGWNPEQDLSILYGSLGVEWLQKGAVDAVVLDETPYAYAMSIGLKPIADLARMERADPVLRRQRDENMAGDWKQSRHRQAFPEGARRIHRADEEGSGGRQSRDREVVWHHRSAPPAADVGVGAKEMPKKPYPAVAGIKKVMELYNYHEMRQHKAEDFYDDTLMREIDQSGFIDALYKK